MRHVLILFASILLVAVSSATRADPCRLDLPSALYTQRSTFDGECANGYAHGRGSVRVDFKANGKRFSGVLSAQFTRGVPSGPGSFVTDDGQKRFDGTFRDGAMWEGRATSVDPDGTVWVDEFQNGRQIGRQAMQPAYGRSDPYTSNNADQMYRGNSYTEEPHQQTDLLSGLVSGVARAIVDAAPQAIDNAYRRKHAPIPEHEVSQRSAYASQYDGGSASVQGTQQEPDAGKRMVAEQKERWKKNRELRESERTRKQQARDEAWNTKQALKQRQSAEQQAEWARESQDKQATLKKQAHDRELQLEAERALQAKREEALAAERDRQYREEQAIHEQERLERKAQWDRKLEERNTRIERQNEERRAQQEEQQRIHDAERAERQEWYRKQQEERQARIDRAGQEAANRQAESERLAQQEREDAERERLLRERDRLQTEANRLQEEVARRQQSQNGTPQNQQDEAHRQELLRYRDQLQAEVGRLQGAVDRRQQSQTASPQPVAPPAASRSNSQAPTLDKRIAQNAPENSVSKPPTLDDVFSESDRRWLDGLPPDYQQEVRDISPPRVAEYKQTGEWAKIKSDITARANDPARIQKMEKDAFWASIKDDIAHPGAAFSRAPGYAKEHPVEVAITTLTLAPGLGQAAVGVAATGKVISAGGKAVAGIAERKAGQVAVESTASRGIDATVQNGTKAIVDSSGKTSIYTATESGVTRYVGITDDLETRAATHLREKGIMIEQIPGLRNLSREDARAVEQVLIEYHGLGKNGGTLTNKINSIARTNPTYAQSLEHGRELLKRAGYPGF